MYDLNTIAMWIGIAGALMLGAGALWWALVGKKGEAEKGSKIAIIGAIVLVSALVAWGANTGLLPSGGPAGGDDDQGGSLITGSETYTASSTWANSSLVTGSASARKFVWHPIVNTTAGTIDNATDSTNVTFTIDRDIDVDATTYLDVYVSSFTYQAGDGRELPVVNYLTASETYDVTYGQDGLGASSRKSETSPFKVKWAIDSTTETHTCSLNITLNDAFADALGEDFGTVAPDDVPYFVIHLVGGGTTIEITVEIALANVYA